MIVRKDELHSEQRENMRGGEGMVTFTHLEDAQQLSNGRLFATLTLPPGSSIGPHAHEGETEYYYILRGTGEVAEADGTKQVEPGDVVITGNGASHSISNTGDDTLEFVALILLDA